MKGQYFGQLCAVKSWSFDKSSYACKGWIEYFLYGTRVLLRHIRLRDIMAHWHTRIIVISLSAGLTSLTVSHSWWCRRLRSPLPRAPPWPSPATSTRLHSSWPPPSQPTFWLLALWWIFLGAQILTLKLATNNLLYEKRWNSAPPL